MRNRGTLIFGVAAILFASLIVGSSSFAYFSDTETSTGNIFTVGTLDVKIRDGIYVYQDDIGPVWTLTDFKPGDAESRSFDFMNFGSVAIDHMEITCDYSVVEEIPQTESDTDPDTDLHPEEMAEEFMITELWMYKDGGSKTDILGKLNDWNLNGWKDLEDLKNSGIDGVTIVPNPNQVSYTTVDIKLQFNPLANNDFQGDTLYLDMIFTFNQHSSQ